MLKAIDKCSNARFEAFDGILNTIKPTGISSFSFMRQVQRKLGIKKIGHLGTLDPNACGVLVLLCGKATKLNQKLSAGTKVYRSVFTFGIETDTLDPCGKIIARSDAIPTQEQIKEVLKSLVGNTEIEVPKFSAVHINGQRAYDLARQSIDFTPPKKNVKIYRFELLKQIAPNKFFVEIECETGTYVRSLAKLIASKLCIVTTYEDKKDSQYYAIASSILRTRVGTFDIQHAKNLECITINDMMQM